MKTPFSSPCDARRCCRCSQTWPYAASTELDNSLVRVAHVRCDALRAFGRSAAALAATALLLLAPTTSVATREPPPAAPPSVRAVFPLEADILNYCTASDEVRVRKEARDLTITERTRLMTAWRTLIDDGTFLALVPIHRLHLLSAYGGPQFLPWHRAHVLAWDNVLRRIDPDVTLAYCTLEYFEEGEPVVHDVPFLVAASPAAESLPLPHSSSTASVCAVFLAPLCIYTVPSGDWSIDAASPLTS